MEVLTLLFVEFRKCMMLFDEFRSMKLHLIVNNRCAYFVSASQVNVLVSLSGLTHRGSMTHKFFIEHLVSALKISKWLSLFSFSLWSENKVCHLCLACPSFSGDA